MKPGFAISLGAHLALIGWAAFDGVFNEPPAPGLRVSTVEVLSEAEFAALTDPAAGSPQPVVDTALTAPSPPEIATPEPAITPSDPTPPPRPAPEPDRVDAPPEEVVPDLSDLTDPAPETEVTAVAPPSPPTPNVPEGAALTLSPDAQPSPRPAPRIAPTAAPAPQVDTALTESPETALLPDPAPADPLEPEPEEEPSALPEATTQTVPDPQEEEAGPVVAALAPRGSPRPSPRPNRPAPAPSDTAASAEQDTPARPSEQAADADGIGAAPVGPPLTGGERDALRLAVQRCWNLGTASTEALRTTVTVYLRMAPDGRPEAGSLRLAGFSGGSEAAARIAYDAARRAILRCGQSGYDLPPEKYAQWQEIEMVFRPDGMRLR